MEKKFIKLTYGENLTSVFGAGFIAFGIGVYLADYFKGFIIFIIILGILMHSYGMYKGHARNK